MFIKAYSECMAYSVIFRIADIYSQFQVSYSSITQEQFRHILTLIQTDSGILRTLAYLGTQCFMHIQAYSAPSNIIVIKQYFMQNKHFSNLE